MPKGKVKSFLVVNDIFKLAMKPLLEKGRENLPQSEKPLTAPSLFMQAGAWLQRGTSDGCGGTQLLQLGVPFTWCPSRSVTSPVSPAVSPHGGWGQSLHGDRADLCSPQDSHSCMGAWMFDLALSPIPFHQQQKSAPCPA